MNKDRRKTVLEVNSIDGLCLFCHCGMKENVQRFDDVARAQMKSTPCNRTTLCMQIVCLRVRNGLARNRTILTYLRLHFWSRYGGAFFHKRVQFICQPTLSIRILGGH